MIQREIEEFKNLLLEKDKLKKDMIEKISNNPDYVLEIYKKYPWFFSVLYLSFRKYNYNCPDGVIEILRSTFFKMHQLIIV